MTAALSPLRSVLRALGIWLARGAALAALAGCAATRELIDTTPLHTDWAECDLKAGGSGLAACLATQLGKAEEALRASYDKLLQANRGSERALIAQEHDLWLALRDRECRVSLQQTAGTSWIEGLARDQSQALCVLTLTRLRESELRLYGGSSYARMMAARVNPRRTYQITSFESHSEGKWYFEVSIDATQLALAMDALIFVGVQGESGDIGRLVTVRPDGGGIGQMVLLLPAKSRIGVAVDLDAGQVYLRENGKWITGAPESGAGLAIRKNSRVKASVNSSVPLNAAIDQKLVLINFGTLPFAEAPPAGFAPYRSGTPPRHPEVSSPQSGTYIAR